MPCQIDKDIERQETLLGELKDFADKLERAAKLNFDKQENLDSDVKYDPDLNDGVVLNIAPLWELVPWKEAKNYWEELLEGKYGWSSMGIRRSPARISRVELSSSSVAGSPPRSTSAVPITVTSMPSV